MATAAVTVTAPDTHMGSGRTLVGIAASMANGDSTAAIPTLGFDEAAVFVTGTFGAGGNVAVEGSIDNVTWYALPGPTGATIALTAAGVAIVTYLGGRFIRARTTAGDGTTALIASLLLRSRSRG